jgi:hypothetical protein
MKAAWQDSKTLILPEISFLHLDAEPELSSAPIIAPQLCEIGADADFTAVGAPDQRQQPALNALGRRERFTDNTPKPQLLSEIPECVYPGNASHSRRI